MKNNLLLILLPRLKKKLTMMKHKFQIKSLRLMLRQPHIRLLTTKKSKLRLLMSSKMSSLLKMLKRKMMRLQFNELRSDLNITVSLMNE